MSHKLIDMSRDFEVWDNTESVFLEVARRSYLVPRSYPRTHDLTGQASAIVQDPPSAAQADYIRVAKRRALTWKELSASNGAYTGNDLVWLFPQEVMVNGLNPKPGDVVRDQDGRRWTALEVQHGKWRETWRLVTRDLVLAFDLRDSIDIERPALSYDAAGAAVLRYPTGPDPTKFGGVVLYHNLPARIQEIDREIVDERGIHGFRGRYQIIVGRQIDVNEDDRIVFHGRYYDIIGLHDPDRLDMLPVLDCELRP
jgi:hypothetical protein